MKKASLGTLFLTVFLDLLGFGLVIPFLPGVARSLGAGDFVATLPGAVYSLMQFLFVPIWGRLSDRIGRRPVLLTSIAGSVLGMAALGAANSLVLIFAARIFSGIATANIAVAQAYIADVTTPENRARGMGIIGMAFGLGFIIGPFVGGELGHFVVLG
ncbi:MAG TPA: MFS transporter, partial [Polyangia bacterium]|nr:MFS transporter [Polyangia bacterium]